MKKKYDFKRGEYITTNKQEKTHWRMIKDLGYQNKKRKVLVICDCGAMHTRFLSEIVLGNSTQCIKCKEPIDKIVQNKTKKNMDQWHGMQDK